MNDPAAMARVLIVDDQPDNLYLLSTLLVGHGYRVDSAPNGQEALRIARQSPPDLIITDLLMPVMDGYTFLRHCKADDRLRPIPIVVYTATYTEPEDERLAARLGAAAFIVKPAEPEELLERIRNLPAAGAIEPSPAGDTPDTADTLLREYNQALVRKLESKTLQLEAANRALQQDIAARKVSEQRIQHLNRVYSILSAINQSISREGTPQTILAEACRIAVEKGQFRMAWVGKLDGTGQRVEPAASAGDVDGYLDAVQISLDITSNRAGPTARTLLSGKHTICNDIANDPLFAPWRSEALQRGYRSSASLPLMVNGELFAVFNLYAAEPHFFDDEELQLLDDLAVDMGLALEIHDIEQQRRRAEEELQASEERFREVVENIHEVFWVTDPAKSQILYISPAYQAIWGRSCESLYESPHSWLDAIHADDRERVAEADKSQQVGGDYDEIYRITRPDGSVRWIRDRAFPIRDAEGAVHRVVGTAEDITERRQLEEQFRQAQKMEAIGTLASGIAHDFNNIISAILGNAELALADIDPGHPASESLKEIETAGLRARSLVERILTFSRQHPQEQSVVALPPLIEETVRLLRATLPAGLELTTSLSPSAPNVLADATQIQQVLLNLGTNAWHALDGMAGRIEITLDAVDLDGQAAGEFDAIRPGRYACLKVSDSGRGMDASTLARAFEPFFTTKEPGKGTGLGLSVVHGIVHRHGGTVTLTSDPGNGTTCRICLPATETAANAPAAAATAMPRGDGQRILYLDDEDPLVFLAERILRRLGYHVTGFTSPAEALQAFRDHPLSFDLIITDLNMPGSSGLVVAREMLQLRPEIPVILTSGYISEELKQQAQQAGIAHLLYKANTVDELADAVARFCETSAS